jgi:predicted alpha-1,2-mannosidase
MKWNRFIASRRPEARCHPALETLESRWLPSLTDYVNPFVGTSGSGWLAGDTFPGADRPFGMLQWSPDTPSNIPGGYRYADNVIKGFSLDHFSGRGITYLEDIPLMPIPGAVTQSPVANPNAFRSTFSHVNETASPGYYGVTLDSGASVELTTTLRTGIGRFAFDTGTSTNSIIVNIGGSVNGVSNGAVTINGNEVTGWAQTTIGGSSAGYRVYFTAQFDQPATAFGTWTGTTLQPSSTSAAGGQAGAYLTFDTGTNSVVTVKTAISFVSVANAQQNLQAENPGWDFNAVAQATRDDWENHLSVIQVDGPSEIDKQVFYTALYHTMFHPNIFDDVNGQYLGFDGAVHTVAPGHHQYENIPGWDQYRSESQLLAFLEPDVMSDVVRSYINDAVQGGGGLPRWEQTNRNSDGMVGDGPPIIIANANAFGATDFDTSAALTAMLKNAGVPGTLSDGQTVRTNLSEYLTNGYIGQDHNGASASYTLEYASSDFAVSQYALSLGDTTDAQAFLQHAQNWQNLFNPDTGYITPRNSDGTFITIAPASNTGFTEGSQAQYTWLVPFDQRGLFDAMGGNAATVSRLDNFFTRLNDLPTSIYAFMGNEPCEETPWTYDFAGAPWRTQDVVRRIQTELFTTLPNGIPGNDDAGSLSSWYIWSALGLYPDIPGVGGFVIGSPLFSSITVNLQGGQTVQIDAPNAADGNPYVQDMQINGVPNTSLWLPVSVLLNNTATTLTFGLDRKPNMKWGSNPADAPPSWDGSATPPRAPANLVAVAGDGLVTLSWVTSAGAAYYNIYRGTSPGGEDSTPIAAGVTATAFTDTGLPNDGTTYYYVVTAVNGFGESDRSNEAAATPGASVPFNLHINFSDNLGQVPLGYINDVGQAFANRGNGFRFGWNQDNADNARDRDDPRAPDERYDSFIHLQKPSNPDASWRTALPNGTYTVHLVSGDIQDVFDASYAIDVQGILALRGTPTPANKFFEATVTVAVTDGFLTMSNDPLGINNKIDFIDITQMAAAGVDFGGGFAGAAGLTLNGAAAISGDRLRLTDGGTREAGSAFFATPLEAQAFTTHFTFQLTDPRADGFTFTLQGVDPTALGRWGGSLGYKGIGRSVAIKFGLHDSRGGGRDSTGLYLNGAFPGARGAVDLSGSGIDLHSGDVFDVAMTYDGTMLDVTITDTATGATASQSYPVDIAAAIGGPLAYVGFTAGTGAQTATQDILSWTYDPGASSGGAPVGRVGREVSHSLLEREEKPVPAFAGGSELASIPVERIADPSERPEGSPIRPSKTSHHALSEARPLRGSAPFESDPDVW